MRTSMRIDNKDALQALDDLKRAGANMRDVYAGIGAVLKSNIQLGYRTGTDPYGSPWDPVQDRPGGRPLRDKGNLRDAWDYTPGDDQVELHNNRTVSYKGDTWSLAAIHHFGATIEPRADGPGYLKWIDRGSGNTVIADKSILPARRQIPDERGWPDGWAEDVFDVIGQHFQRV